MDGDGAPEPTEGLMKIDGTKALPYLGALSAMLIAFYFAAGCVLAGAFTQYWAQFNRLYAADLAGASIGCAASLGMMVRYGRFKFLDLGDLTRRKELPLVCPRNLLGQVDLFLISHHGFAFSNSKALVDAVHPRVAVNINSTHKGGDATAWQIVHDAPGLQDLWQLHYSIAAGPEHSSAADFVANVDDNSDGHWIKASVSADGSFTVVNSRNGFEKTYKK